MKPVIERLKNQDFSHLETLLKDVIYLKDEAFNKYEDKHIILTRLKALFSEDFVVEYYQHLVFFTFAKFHMKWQTYEGSIRYIFIAKRDDTKGRVKIDFSYDGSHYEGFQRQKDKSQTIQQEIENVLAHLFDTKPSVHAAGRTDKKVHAYHQVAHIDRPKRINSKKLHYLLNKMLPDDIYVFACEEISPLFHARFDVYSKTYRYTLLKHPDPLKAHYGYHVKQLDISRLKTILQPLIGTHDFLSFSKFEVEKPTVKTITDIKILESPKAYHIDITGKGFLRYMVRIIIGNALFDLTHDTNLIIENLKNPSKDAKKHLAPSEGLYLKDIVY